MPLNINTLGPGIGSGSNGGGFSIENNGNKTEVISSMYDVSVTTMSADKNYTKYACELSICVTVRFKNATYQVVTEVGGKTKIRKVNIAFIEGSPSMTYTYVCTLPCEASDYENWHAVSIGNYIYIYKTRFATTDVWMWRFDGTSYTEVTDSVGTFHLLFKESPIYKDDIMPAIFPLFKKGNTSDFIVSATCYSSWELDYGKTHIAYISTSGENITCEKNMKWTYTSSNNAGGYAVSFAGDDEWNGYCGKMIDINTYITYSWESSVTRKKIRKYTYKYDASTGNYVPTYTESTSNLSKASAAAEEGNYTACHTFRLSYPEHDTYLLITTNSYTSYGEDQWQRGWWYLLRATDDGIAETELALPSGCLGEDKMTDEGGTNPSYAHMFVDINTPNPYIAYVVRDPINANTNDFQYYHYIHALKSDITYKSDRSRCILTAYLQAGDTVYCDDTIYSYEFSGSSHRVNATKLSITTNGTYKITTGVYDSLYEPSIIVVDKNGIIVHFKYEIRPDGSLLCFPIKGMRINGTVITESHKQTITKPINNRFYISMK